MVCVITTFSHVAYENALIVLMDLLKFAGIYMSRILKNEFAKIYQCSVNIVLEMTVNLSMLFSLK